MPYIKEHTREMAASDPVAPGELNYALTKRALGCHGHLLRSLREIVDTYVLHEHADVVRYDVINEVIGALTCAGMEARRRGYSDAPFKIVAQDWYDEVAASYEDLCIAKNGDVYP